MILTIKLQPIFIILSAIAGLFIGRITFFGDVSVYLIEPFLMILLFMVFLSVDLKNIKKSFMNYKFTVISLIINFLWTPIFAVVLGMLFLNDSIDLQVGFLMLLVTPCTDWYLVFTGLSKGNVNLGATILPLNLLLQVILLPVYLFIFMGNKMNINSTAILESIIYVLIIPMILAQIMKYLSTKRIDTKLVLDKMMKHNDNIQLILLCGAVVAMFASEARYIFDYPILLFKMFLPLGFFFSINFILVYFIADYLKMNFPDMISLIMTTLARNSPLSLAIAVVSFPDRPLISLALVIGPLIELPVLGIVSNILLRIGKNKQFSNI